MDVTAELPLTSDGCVLAPGPRTVEGNPTLCAENPSPSYSILLFLIVFMVTSSSSSKSELGNQMPSVVTSRGPLATWRVPPLVSVWK